VPAIERLRATCPADAELARIVVQRDATRGQRCHVRVVFQRHGYPWETRADAARAIGGDGGRSW
jgi:hypothetical protein